MRIEKLLVALAALAWLGSCSGASPQRVDTSVFGAAENWTKSGGDWAESHFSRLADIGKANAATLGFAWQYDLGTDRGQEATPIVIDGIMVTSGNLGRVYALDGASGRQLWTFTPKIDMQYNRYACCDQANRGVAVADGKVFVAALDGWLYALDRKTGAVLWKADTFPDRSRGYTSTGAPEVAGDIVVIGNAGAEYDTRGYVTAYRVKDGTQAWRFWTVPHDPKLGPQESDALEHALKTWSPKSRWDIGGGGTAWNAITYDPDFDQVIIGVGNGGPYSQSVRSPGGGDNLYIGSLVAVDRKTGKMKWYFQETPGDNWDFTSVQPMVLARLSIGGHERPVILHTPKNGFFFVLDRETGRALAIHQMVRTSWASGWDLKTQRPILTPQWSDPSTGPKLVFPAPPGARNWYGAAFDPKRNLYVASYIDMGNMVVLPPENANPPRHRQALNAGTESIFTPYLQAALPGLPKPMQEQVKALPQWQWVKDKPWSSDIRAIDPVSGHVRWTYQRDGWQDRSGVLATETGLSIFGTLSGKLVVVDSDSGKVLKEIQTGSSIMAAPMTFKAGGVQYIAVQAGWGGGGWGLVPDYSAAYRKGNANRILVFRLGGGSVPVPADVAPDPATPEPPAQAAGVTAAAIDEGKRLFSRNCSICHSNLPHAPAPNLFKMPAEIHTSFDRIVRQGMLVPNDMPRWDDALSPGEVKAIHAYLIDMQAKGRAREAKGAPQPKPIYSRISSGPSNF